MFNSRQDHHLIRLSTPVYPTAAQALRFSHWAQVVRDAQFRATSAVIPPQSGPSAGMVTLPSLSRAEVTAALLRVCPEWPESLPPGAWRGVASQAYALWRPLMGQAVSTAQLRQLVGAAVPLDESVQASGPCSVQIDGIPEPVVADLWRVPCGLTDALLRSAADYRRSVQHDVQRWRAADRAGDPAALARLHELACRHGVLLDAPDVGPGVERARPHRARHATLRHGRQPDGQRGWMIDWSLRLPPAWLPAAWRDDVVGVDLGIRAPITWVSGTAHGQLRRSSLPTGGWTPGSTGTPLADAVVRHTQFARLRDDLNATLTHLLSYRHVAIEDMNWHNFTPGVRDAMDCTGVTSVLEWLTSLGRVSGTRVVPVAPAGTSQHCAQCGRAGQLDGVLFLCPGAACRPADRDLNAAGYIRRLGRRSVL